MVFVLLETLKSAPLKHHLSCKQEAETGRQEGPCLWPYS